MKYYVYISDAKVDMLFPQVPHEIKRRVATEWKMDLKLLSASRRTESESEDNRIARLETVADFIRQSARVGTVDSPCEYVADTLPLRWGDYGWDRKSPVVYFGGETERTIVGLGGSSKHLVGSSVTSAAEPHSAMPYLIKFLGEGLRQQENESSEKPGSHVAIFPYPFTPIAAVEYSILQMQGPPQNVEFLAKRLAYGPVEKHAELKEKHVLLATPLYVALAD